MKKKENKLIVPNVTMSSDYYTDLSIHHLLSLWLYDRLWIFIRQEKLFLKYINIPTHTGAYTFEINPDVNIVCMLTLYSPPPSLSYFFIIYRIEKLSSWVVHFSRTFLLFRRAAHVHFSPAQLIDIKAILNDSNKSVVFFRTKVTFYRVWQKHQNINTVETIWSISESKSHAEVNTILDGDLNHS